MDEPAAGRSDGKIIERLTRFGVVLLRFGEARAVALFLQQRQQRGERCTDVADDADIDGGAAADVLRPDVHLRDANAVSLRVELTIREVGPEHQQDAAVEHGVVAGGEADESGHTDVIRIVPLDVLLAAQCVHHRRLEALAQRDELVVRALASRAAQDGDALVAVEQRREPIEIGRRWRDDGHGRQEPTRRGRRRFGCTLQCHVARQHHHRHAALADGLANRNLQHTRHLAGGRDELAVVAAFLEQRFRMRLLEIAAADLSRGDLRGDAEHWDARAVAIE
jgi:hypothetical protein